MRVKLLITFLLIGQTLSAQIFTEDTSPLIPNAGVDTAFVNIYEAALAFADIDGDNDQDLLMMTRGMLPTLYTNDGMGKFSEVSATSFEPSGYFGAIAFADVNKMVSIIPLSPSPN